MGELVKFIPFTADAGSYVPTMVEKELTSPKETKRTQVSYIPCGAKRDQSIPQLCPPSFGGLTRLVKPVVVHRVQDKVGGRAASEQGAGNRPFTFSLLQLY